MFRQRRWRHWAGPMRRSPAYGPSLYDPPQVGYSQPYHLHSRRRLFTHPRMMQSFLPGRSRPRDQFAIHAHPFQPTQVQRALVPGVRNMRRRSLLYHPRAHMPVQPYLAPPSEPLVLLPASTLEALAYQQPALYSQQTVADQVSRKQRNRGSRIIGPSPSVRAPAQTMDNRQRQPVVQATTAAQNVSQPAPARLTSISRRSAPQPAIQQQDKPTISRSRSAPPPMRRAQTLATTTRSMSVYPAHNGRQTSRSVPRSHSAVPRGVSQTGRPALLPKETRRSGSSGTRVRKGHVDKAPLPDMPSYGRTVTSAKTLDKVIEKHQEQRTIPKSAPTPDLQAASLPASLPSASLKEGDPVTIIRPGHLSRHLGIVHETRPANMFRSKDTKVFDWKDGGSEWYDSKRELAPASAADRMRARPPAEGLPAQAQPFDQTNLPPLSLSL